jgi:hypothetical protein
MKRWEEQNVLIRDLMKMGKIVKVLNEDRYLVSYYNEKNKFKYRIIEDSDIIDEKEYEIIRKRTNRINKLLG